MINHIPKTYRSAFSPRLTVRTVKELTETGRGNTDPIRGCWPSWWLTPIRTQYTDRRRLLRFFSVVWIVGLTSLLACFCFHDCKKGLSLSFRFKPMLNKPLCDLDLLWLQDFLPFPMSLYKWWLWNPL